MHISVHYTKSEDEEGTAGVKGEGCENQMKVKKLKIGFDFTQVHFTY